MTPKGAKENPLATELRAERQRGRSQPQAVKDKCSEAQRARWAAGAYEGVNFHPGALGKRH